MSSKSSLSIHQYEIGPLNNFLYLLGDLQTKEMAVVDPAWDVPFLCQQAEKLDYKITKVFSLLPPVHSFVMNKFFLHINFEFMKRFALSCLHAGR